jgi:hypothetical protein
VTQALSQRGLRRMDFRFEEGGARVLLNAGLRLPAMEAPTPDDGRQTTDDSPSMLANDEGQRSKAEIRPSPENPANGSRTTHHVSSGKAPSSPEDA